MKKSFSARIQDKKFFFKNPKEWQDFLDKMGDQDVFVSLETQYKKRSDRQNKYYFGVVIAYLSDHTGHSSDECHDAMRFEYLFDKTSILPIIRSTTDLSTMEFERYMEDIRSFARRDLALDIPEPNECEDRFRYDWLDMENKL